MKLYFILYITILVLGLIIGGIRNRKLSQSSKLIYLLLWLTLVTEIIAKSFAQLYKTNLIVYHFFTPLQYVLIALSFNKELKLPSKLVVISIIVVMTLSIISFVIMQDRFPTYPKIVSNILVIAWCLLYLYQLLKYADIYPFSHYPLFWLSTGFSIYAIMTLFNLGSFNYISNYADKLFFTVFRYIRIVVNYLLYTLFIVSFLSNQRVLLKK